MLSELGSRARTRGRAGRPPDPPGGRRGRRTRRIVGAHPLGGGGRRTRRLAGGSRGRRRRVRRPRPSTSSTPTRSWAASRSGPRHRGEYSDDERSLLRTVAGQAAASVANVRLTARLAEQLAELTASRERLVAAQDGERRRLERDLHDGIQQDIVAQIAGLRLARNRLDRGRARVGRPGGAAGAGPSDVDRPARARARHPPAGAERQRAGGRDRVRASARYPIPLTVEADARGPGRTVSRRGRDDRVLRRAGGAREHGEARATRAAATVALARVGRPSARRRSAMTDAASARSLRHRRTAAGSRTSETASPRSAARCASRRSSRPAPGRWWTWTSPSAGTRVTDPEWRPASTGEHGWPSPALRRGGGR